MEGQEPQGITGKTEPTAPYDLSLRSSLQYRHVTKPLAASVPLETEVNH